MLGVGPPPVPVMLYGAAHPRGRGLQDVRRSLGYFRGASAGVRASANVAQPVQPDGPCWTQPLLSPSHDLLEGVLSIRADADVLSCRQRRSRHNGHAAACRAVDRRHLGVGRVRAGLRPSRGRPRGRRGLHRRHAVGDQPERAAGDRRCGCEPPDSPPPERPRRRAGSCGGDGFASQQWCAAINHEGRFRPCHPTSPSYVATRSRWNRGFDAAQAWR